MKKILVICGPTAVGKTDLALQLAGKFRGELIAADSRQAYKDLDIGTGKYSPNDKFQKYSGRWLLNDVWIHGYDLVKPGKQFTAADFVKFFWKVTQKIWEKEKLPILVGGTGFYIKATLEDFETLGIPANLQLRGELEKLPKEELFKKLFRIDKERAKKLSPSDRLNPRRLIRAIEIAEFKKHQIKIVPTYPYMWKKTGAEILKIGLNCERKELFQRIDERVEERLKIGMLTEVRTLLKDKVSPNWLESLGLEYYWITEYLLGKIDYHEMVNRLKTDIHGFAKRQLTWFKKDPNIIWFDIEEKDFYQKVEKCFEKWLNY